MKKILTLAFVYLACCIGAFGQKTGAADAFLPAPITCDPPYISTVKTGIDRLFTGLKYGTQSYARDTIIVCDGNSITAAAEGGQVDDANSYPRQLAALVDFANVSAVYNFGVGGQTTQNMLADAGTQIDPLCTADKKCILIVWELTNSIAAGATAQQGYDLLKQYCDERKAAKPWTIIVIEALPRSNSNCTVTSLDVPLVEANTLLRAGWRDFADAAVFVRDDARLATIGSACITWLPDGVHPSASAFSTIMVPMFRDALLSLNCQ